MRHEEVLLLCRSTKVAFHRKSDYLNLLITSYSQSQAFQDISELQKQTCQRISDAFLTFHPIPSSAEWSVRNSNSIWHRFRRCYSCCFPISRRAWCYRPKLYRVGWQGHGALNAKCCRVNRVESMTEICSRTCIVKRQLLDSVSSRAKLRMRYRVPLRYITLPTISMMSHQWKHYLTGISSTRDMVPPDILFQFSELCVLSKQAYNILSIDESILFTKKYYRPIPFNPPTWVGTGRRAVGK